jgi:hypothetical protein
MDNLCTVPGVPNTSGENDSEKLENPVVRNLWEVENFKSWNKFTENFN